MPEGLTAIEEAFYHGDVYFYCGMCAMVRQLSLTIHAFIPSSEFPSRNILGYNISLKDADKILNSRYGSIPDRISLILNERNTDTIQEKLKDLYNRLNSKDVHSCLKSVSCIMLNNYKPQMILFKDEEEYLNNILDTLLFKTGGETSSCFNFHFLVDVIQSGLIMSWELFEIGSGFIKVMGGDIKVCSDYFQKFILQRIKKIRKDKWPLPQRWKAAILQNMEVLYLLSESEDKKNSEERTEPKRLIWKDTGQKFAAFVAPAIQKGLIELEGNESQGPLLERLTQYIRIEKVKGSGGLGQESLVTYLKQAIRED